MAREAVQHAIKEWKSIVVLSEFTISIISRSLALDLKSASTHLYPGYPNKEYSLHQYNSYEVVSERLEGSDQGSENYLNFDVELPHLHETKLKSRSPG